MKIRNLFILGFASAALVSCGGNANTESGKAADDSLKMEMMTMAQMAFPALAMNADNPQNPSTPEKIALGKMLYYDVRLSKDESISCNSCHNLSTYGVDNKSFSTGVGGQLGGRNSPTVLNAAFHNAQFWDGRMKDVEEQAGGPILNPVEMAIPNEAFLLKKLKGIKEYQDMFKAAFPEAKDAITYENLRFAIAAFERTLITPSVYDKFVAGDTNALSIQQLKGLKTFTSVGCQSCHQGSNFGGTMFQKFGVYGDYWTLTKSAKVDSGRVSITKNSADLYGFKVMALRNIEKTAPYFHDGSVADLKQAINIMAKAELNKDLSSEEIDNIYAFLQSLTGEVPVSALQK